MNTVASETDTDTPAIPRSPDIPVSLPAGDALARLDFLTVLRVSGDDARVYLQGQLTADVGEIGASASRIAAWCSPKGRVLALFRLLADPAGGYRVICERWIAATLLARLRMFVLRSNVRIDDVGDALEVAGVTGVLALPDPLAAWARTAEVDDAAAFEEVTVARVPGYHRRFLVTGAAARMASITRARWADGTRQASAGAWRLADICAGIPRITAKSSDAFLPQMLNLDRLRAVSFEKGCYVGQEIVARAQHLGRVKRRAFVGRTTAAAEGDPVVDATEHEASKVGVVIAVEPHPDGGSAALVVLEIASARSAALRVGGPDGPAIRISSADFREHGG